MDFEELAVAVRSIITAPRQEIDQRVRDILDAADDYAGTGNAQSAVPHSVLVDCLPVVRMCWMKSLQRRCGCTGRRSGLILPRSVRRER